MEDAPQKHGYIISSYELICFSYTSISDETKQNKNKSKKKMLQEIFFRLLTCLILILFLFFKGAKSEEY